MAELQNAFIFVICFRTSVDSLIADSFPARSTEYPLNSPKYFEYIGALDAVI